MLKIRNEDTEKDIIDIVAVFRISQFVPILFADFEQLWLMYMFLFKFKGGGWQASAKNARLYFEDDYDDKRIGSWCAASHASAKSSKGYVQVDLGRRKTITYIATQGKLIHFLVLQ